MAAPQSQSMAREQDVVLQPAPPAVCWPFSLCVNPTPRLRRTRPETIFYDSATAKRTLAGKVHYCLACPGWSKSTSMRVVYSRWDLVTPGEACSKCMGCCGMCGQGEAGTWMPPPEMKCFKTPPAGAADEAGCCDGWKLPVGRTLDTFDADIIIDASSHQTCCQICRGEGDMILYRKAGADLSDPNEVFVMTDVVRPFDVFNDLTFELSKINLQGATTQALGARMGATVWNYDARSGAAETQKAWRGEKEHVFYDSLTARRTLIGGLCHMDCCCPPIYKVTSERVMYTEWDMWYLCDDPLNTCTCWPYYCARSCARECCCAVGASAAAAERLEAKLNAPKRAETAKNRDSCGRCCRVPVGRTAEFFDIDIVADVRAHQTCWQLCVAEGNMHFGRMQGGDASADDKTQAFFNVKHVPEVFAHFDEFSYELSKMDLSHFRTGAMRNDIMQAARQ